MSSPRVNLIAPIDSPLPPRTGIDFLTDDQWTTLLAFADTFIADVRPLQSKTSDNALSVSDEEFEKTIALVHGSGDASPSLIRQYLGETFSSIPAAQELLKRTLDGVPPEGKKGIASILSALNTRPGCFLMTGYTTPFHKQPVQIRQQIVQAWVTSYLPLLRGLAKSLGLMAKSVWLKTSPTLGPVLGFPRSPVHGTPGKGFDYDFIHFSPAGDGDGPETIETDVVIIGSGCGGGVCAKNIAEAGHKVVVTDRAYYFPPEHLPMTEMAGGPHLFENGGSVMSDDNSIATMSARVWGGGGTVNWSASLATQQYVREEWSTKDGLKFFTSAEFQKCLDRVCGRMGVSTEHIRHNRTNSSLLEGARRLGYSSRAVPQNTGGKQHYCGYCSLGCGAAEKQGPVVSWLPDAAKAGAKFLEGFEAEEIVFDESPNGTKERIAIGVKGTWHSRNSAGGVSGAPESRTTRQVIIKARRTIVSCGTLQSPLLLLRSGLRGNPHVGRNLHLHPVGVVFATFSASEGPINPWEGGILTAVVESLQDRDGKGHGAKLEAITMLPSLSLPIIPWRNAVAWKTQVAKFKNTLGWISLTRDRDSGRVYPDPKTGKLRIAYTPSAFDRQNTLEGMIALAKIAYVEGAEEINVGIEDFPAFTRTARKPDPDSGYDDGSGGDDDDAGYDSDQGINDPAFQEWLAALRRKGIPAPGDGSVVSAHQMGTCRMSISERDGVVDPRGKVWGAENLYVADASVFPSASGVNPMVTNMAISDWISRGIARGLKKD